MTDDVACSDCFGDHKDVDLGGGKRSALLSGKYPEELCKLDYSNLFRCPSAEAPTPRKTGQDGGVHVVVVRLQYLAGVEAGGKPKVSTIRIYTLWSLSLRAKESVAIY